MSSKTQRQNIQDVPRIIRLHKTNTGFLTQHKGSYAIACIKNSSMIEAVIQQPVESEKRKGKVNSFFFCLLPDRGLLSHFGWRDLYYGRR
jgi:hypothetical protein